jgi:hypothetical protein
MSSSEPARLAPIGRSANATVAAMTVQWRKTSALQLAIFSANNGNPGFPQNGSRSQRNPNRDFDRGVIENCCQRETWNKNAFRPATYDLLLCPHLVKFETRLLEFGVEKPHRVEDFPVICRGSSAIGLTKGEDAVVAQISHDRWVGNSVGKQIA